MACRCLLHGFKKVDVSQVNALTAWQLQAPCWPHPDLQDTATIVGGRRLQHESEPGGPECAPALQLVPLSMTGVGEPGWTSALACQDRCVRFLHRSTMVHQVGLSRWTLPGASLNADLVQPDVQAQVNGRAETHMLCPFLVPGACLCLTWGSVHTLWLRTVDVQSVSTAGL